MCLLLKKWRGSTRVCVPEYSSNCSKSTLLSCDVWWRTCRPADQHRWCFQYWLQIEPRGSLQVLRGDPDPSRTPGRERGLSVGGSWPGEGCFCSGRRSPRCPGWSFLFHQRPEHAEQKGDPDRWTVTVKECNYFSKYCTAVGYSCIQYICWWFQIPFEGKRYFHYIY